MTRRAVDPGDELRQYPHLGPHGLGLDCYEEFDGGAGDVVVAAVGDVEGENA